MSMQAEYYDEEDLGKTITTSDIDESQLDEAKEWRSRMVEAICETDDTLAEKFLLEEEITVEELKRGLRKATIATEIIPVTCGASYKNKGVQLLLDAMVDYLPSPSISACRRDQPEDGGESNARGG